jgi:hypothetical protein
MSSTPTLERRDVAAEADWVDIAPPRTSARFTGANVVVALSALRHSIFDGSDDGVVVDTDQFRPVDEMDIEASEQAAQRWND